MKPVPEEITRADLRIDEIASKIDMLRRQIEKLDAERKPLLDLTSDYWTARQMEEYLESREDAEV
jgi:prefoldin subunit 5